jgi:chaperonin GroES
MATTNIQPLADKVLIKPTPKEEVTASGIVLPDTVSKERPQMGEVLAVGDGAVTPEGKVIAPKVKVGQKVYFTKYGPTEIKVGNEELLIVEEKDILAIIA